MRLGHRHQHAGAQRAPSLPAPSRAHGRVWGLPSGGGQTFARARPSRAPLPGPAGPRCGRAEAGRCRWAVFRGLGRRRCPEAARHVSGAGSRCRGGPVSRGGTTSASYLVFGLFRPRSVLFRRRTAMSGESSKNGLYTLTLPPVTFVPAADRPGRQLRHCPHRNDSNRGAFDMGSLSIRLSASPGAYLVSVAEGSGRVTL